MFIDIPEDKRLLQKRTGMANYQVPKSSFILAYQLLRIRRKLLDQSLDAVEENKWALFNDDEEEDTSTAKIIDDLQIDHVTDETEWDDGRAI